jgi:hypothetical protein
MYVPELDLAVEAGMEAALVRPPECREDAVV